MTKKVAVVLSGCGVFDGSEIYESVLTLLHLEQAGAEVKVFAPNINQMHVLNHITGNEMPETRNVLIEASRIVRGDINDITTATSDDFDAMIVPGGFGAAKNLSDFATQGSGLTVQTDFLKFSQAMHQASKPIGLICIAPAMSAKICGDGVECTIGNDLDTASAIEATGAKHIDCPVECAHIDRKKKLVTTPAYMLAGKISEASAGIKQLVNDVLDLCE